MIFARYPCMGCGYFAEFGLQNAESCQGVICGKSVAERSANYPLSLFRIPQLKNSAFPRIAKLPFTRVVQQMCNPCIAASGVPQSFPSVFFVVRLPKNKVVFFTISTNFEVSPAFQVSCHFVVNVTGFNL